MSNGDKFSCKSLLKMFWCKIFVFCCCLETIFCSIGQSRWDPLSLDALMEPKKSLGNPLCPESVLKFTKNDVKFDLFSKIHKFGADVTHKQEFIPKNEPIKFIIHGFLNDENSPMIQTVKNAYMKQKINVVVVDWSKGSGTLLSHYVVCGIPSRIVPMVGDALSDFIFKLIHEQRVSIADINVIGHSLGAQIAGIAGKRLIIRRHKLPVIIGLDPALPEFKNLDIKHRLSSFDADYVEIIHTNPGELGFRIAIGTADYYPNFSERLTRMPGCMTASCSHSMSFQYFSESIVSPLAFKARHCKNYQEMVKGKCDIKGESYMGGNDFKTKKLPGVFILETNKEPPYGKSEKKL